MCSGLFVVKQSETNHPTVENLIRPPVIIDDETRIIIRAFLIYVSRYLHAVNVRKYFSLLYIIFSKWLFFWGAYHRYTNLRSPFRWPLHKPLAPSMFA